MIDADQSRLPQPPQVIGQLGRGDAKALGQLARRGRPAFESLKDGQTRLIGQITQQLHSGIGAGLHVKEEYNDVSESHELCILTIHGMLKRGRTTLTRAIGVQGLPARMRPMAWGGWTSAIGSGLWFTIWALYLTRRIGLSDGQAGLALSIAGAVGFLVPAPLGRIADRCGSRDTYAILLAGEGLAVAGFLFCRTFAEVVVVAALTAACDQGKTGVRTALVAQLAPAAGRLSALASLRACSHAGDAIGAGLGAAVIGLGSGTAYSVGILVNALTYVVYALAVLRVPRVPPPATSRRRVPLQAFRDLPFVTLAALSGFLTLCWGLMSAGLPLWITGDTRAPHALSGVIILISSVAIAAFQVTFSRGVRTPSDASRAAWRSGISLAACCGLVALSAGPAALPATLLLLGAGVAHVVGELWFVAASWGLSVPLMRADRPAEYQGVFATGEALAIMLAPALMSGVIVPGGPTAWLVLGVAFALVGALACPATLWALRTRAHAAADGVPYVETTAAGTLEGR